MSEKHKSRFNEPVYSSTYDNGGWPARDELPTKDPIGDVDDHVKDALRYVTADQGGRYIGEVTDEWVDGYKKWKQDQKKYELTMRPHLKVKENKVFGFDRKTIEEFAATIEPVSFHSPKCNCGIKAVYGDIPAHNHKEYCDLFKAIDGNI